MSDLISRQAAMERLMAQNVIMDGSEYHNGFNAGVNRAQEVIRNLPTVQPNHNAEVSKMVDDLISRQVAQHKINAIIDEFETIMKDIRERHVDDSVCGLCEYDGTWCNECPGFERDDCFKLKDQYREEWAGAIKNLPSAQPKAYTKADYIMALHKEYGCTLTRAEEAHDKALEYLRSKAIVKG
jgi:hypothetical protein